MKQKILVSVADADSEFSVIVEHADMTDIAAILARVEMQRTSFTAGRVMADFVFATNSRADLTVQLTDENPSHFPQAAHVVVSHHNTVYPLIKVFRWESGGIKAKRFSGYLPEFAVWSKRNSQNEALTGKTVVFRYLRGSKQGNRVVEVDKVAYLNGKSYLFGKDVQKNAWRQYDTRHIDGEIIVLDGVKPKLVSA